MTLKTILEINNLTDLMGDAAGLELIDLEAANCRKSGDLLGAGEWLASEFKYIENEKLDEVFSKVIVFWASSMELKTLPSSTEDIIVRIHEFAQEELTIALAAATLRLVHAQQPLPPKVGDLSFRLTETFRKYFRVEAQRPEDLCREASAKLESSLKDLLSAVESFVKTNCTTAKNASIELVRTAKHFKHYAIVSERQILNDVDIILGTAFRKFCESCERNEMRDIFKRGSDIRDQANIIKNLASTWKHSCLWNQVLFRIVEHVNKLVDEGLRRGEQTITPRLKLANNSFKIDLTRLNETMTFSSRLINEGEGRAFNVIVKPEVDKLPIELHIVEPSGQFEISGESEQILTFEIVLKEKRDCFDIPIEWKCSTVIGKSHCDGDKIILFQQQVQPEWVSLIQNPPYTINPIKKRENLFGRDTILNSLILNAAAGTSTFLWGQKRVGKTSVLQVLASELTKRKDFICIVLRMGELGPLHEGQIGHLIAERFYLEIADSNFKIPDESQFPNMSKLIPFIEKTVKCLPDKKLVVIIDEFDDIDPAFYTGERGRLFVKALRSLSEVGLTFFFVGSERMNIIYEKHSSDLNKWVNVYLDYIESREDCKDLIMRPLKGQIEYQAECIDFILDYCGGNPFYMHLFCAEVFNRCSQEKRTYVSESDVYNIRQSLSRSLGETSFSHLWDDNPVLENEEKIKQSSENCLILSCILSLGGVYKTVDDLLNAQDNLGLAALDKLTGREITIVLERLRNRKIIKLIKSDNNWTISLPIFNDWLCHYSELRVLSKWKEFCVHKQSDDNGVAAARIIVGDVLFPIAEDELLSVSQKLYYCGKQKDVSEIRMWLRQFDDDIRIEIAFDLLKRLADAGFVSEGARAMAISKVEQAIKEKRKLIGRGIWEIVRGKIDNLCITYTDADTKSGATLAREFHKRLRASKCGAPDTLSDWMGVHNNKDALIMIVDDFAGTGMTLSKGLKKFFENLASPSITKKYLNEKRIICYVLFSFPEALDQLRSIYPDVDFLSVNVFGDEVRALDSDAKIFKDSSEIAFAKNILVQLGRDLTSQYPLGYGDLAALVAFHDTVPNNTLPIFWSNGIVNDKPWKPLFPRA